MKLIKCNVIFSQTFQRSWQLFEWWCYIMIDLEKSDYTQKGNDLVQLLPSSSTAETKRMEPHTRIRTIIIFCLFLAIAGIIGFGYFCQDQVCALTKRDVLTQTDALPYNDHQSTSNQRKSLLDVSALQEFTSNIGLSYEDVLNEDFQFNMDGHDVMVFLHIQKTGGTSFGRHLVRDLDLKRPCECQRKRKRCYCFRPHRNENWLFSRYSTGWKCGLHADWTELTNCVDQELDKNEGETVKRRYFYISLLREPISRYMSEYRHVRRGATWKGSRHWCMGRQATAEELPSCYKGNDWLDVTLDEFISCDNNLAGNRQTRMLADLALVSCYNKTAIPKDERDKIMLKSAKHNLASMAYFGLTEYQKISQYIFEETFNLRFAIPFEQHNTTISSNSVSNLSKTQKDQIKDQNDLDIELYAFAKNLLFQRFEHLKSKDTDFKRRFENLGNIAFKQGITEFNWDSNMDDGFKSENKNAQHLI